MILYLYLQAKDISAISFQSPLKPFLKSEYKDILIFEADQASDSSHIQIGTGFIDEAEKIMLHIEDDNKTALGTNMKLLEGIRRSKAELLALYHGNANVILNSLQMLKTSPIRKDFENEIRNFLG